MNTAPVTLIIPHRNRGNEIGKLLHSLQKVETLPQQVLIVDDCSQDDQRHLLLNTINACQNLNIRLFGFKRHVGTADAKNLAIAYAKTPYIWFLDSDTEFITSNVLSMGCEILDNNSTIGVIGAEIVRDKGGQNYFREQYLLRSLWSGFIYHSAEKDLRKEVDMISTCNFLTRTDLMKKIGGFHSQLENGEDKLACLQIRELSYKVILDARIGIHHDQSSAGRAEFLTRVRVGFRDVAFIYGATSNLVKLASLHISCTISLWEYYKNIMEMYRLFGNPAASHSRDTLDPERFLGPMNLIRSLRDKGLVMVQYILANKTYMSLKGYYFRKTDKRDFEAVTKRISNLCSEITFDR